MLWLHLVHRPSVGNITSVHHKQACPSFSAGGWGQVTSSSQWKVNRNHLCHFWAEVVESPLVFLLSCLSASAAPEELCGPDDATTIWLSSCPPRSFFPLILDSLLSPACNHYPILGPLDAKSQLIEEDPSTGKAWGQEEKAGTEDEMAGWNHQFNGYEFEQIP